MPVALVTGATRGLGHALAFDFARDGYSVYAAGRGEEALATWDAVMATNVRGPFLLTQRLLPRLASNAAIILVSSGIVEQARPRWGAYYVSKLAVDAVAARSQESGGVRVEVSGEARAVLLSPIPRHPLIPDS